DKGSRPIAVDIRDGCAPPVIDGVTERTIRVVNLSLVPAGKPIDAGRRVAAQRTVGDSFAGARGIGAARLKQDPQARREAVDRGNRRRGRTRASIIRGRARSTFHRLLERAAFVDRADVILRARVSFERAAVCLLVGSGSAARTIAPAS